jgi:hypothetical protein
MGYGIFEKWGVLVAFTLGWGWLVCIWALFNLRRSFAELSGLSFSGYPPEETQ